MGHLGGSRRQLSRVRLKKGIENNASRSMLRELPNSSLGKHVEKEELLVLDCRVLFVVGDARWARGEVRQS